MTLRQITEAASGLGSRDFAGFVERIEAVDSPLGVVVRLHAEIAGPGSPDLDEWIRMTAEESDELSQQGVSSTAEAARWWFTRYGLNLTAEEIENEVEKAERAWARLRAVRAQQS